MSNWNTEELIAADKQFVWHPFTNMPEWCAPELKPIVIVEGHGAILRDSRGREYIDGNSSIWTNIHGHNHPRINLAIREQLERIAHSSFLGTTNPAAIELAREIVQLFPSKTLSRVFYSDDGSTGIEAALRIAAQFFQMRREKRNLFVAFRSGYHGDTAGAAALGAAKMFSVDHDGWRFPVRTVGSTEDLEKLPRGHSRDIAAVVIEPMIQGAAGMRVWPRGTSAKVRDWCNRNGALMIADEVMTGFGRTGKMFGSEHENALPDMMVLGKGLSGGYLPLAITLTSEEIFSQFDGSVADGHALAYGHSYTGNALGCAAARASLAIFREENVLEILQPKIRRLNQLLEELRQVAEVTEVRQCGFIAGVEMGDADMANEVCRRARDYGLLTRNIRETIVLMPPLCTTEKQLERAVSALTSAIREAVRESEGRASARPSEVARS
jgi:adenosylmethionine-8-amino-7-oxononanoate aminotransferase